MVATLLLTPFLVGVLADAGSTTRTSSLLGALVGLLSSVIPYSCEITALRTIRPSVFGILMSLEPAAAALAGIVVVHEFLTGLQWLADGLRRRRAASAPPAPSGPSPHPAPD